MKHWRYILALGAIFGVSFVAWAGQVPNPVNADNTIVAGHFLLGNGAQRATDSGWSLVPMANGGCNAALTATANNLLYSTSSACALLPATNNAVLTTNGSGALTWSTTLPAGALPLPTASTLGGLEAITCASHLWIDAIPTTLTQPACAQPGAADLSNGVTGTGAVVLASAPTIANLALSGAVSGSNAIPLGILAQQTTKCVLGNGSGATANVTCAWTVANTTDTVIPLVHGSLTTDDNVCLNDAAGTLKDCGGTIFGNGTSGQFLQSQGSGAPQYASAGEEFIGNNTGAWAANLNIWTSLSGFSYTLANTQNAMSQIVAKSGTFQSFTCTVLNAPASTNTDTCNLYINGSIGPTCAITGSATTCTDNAHPTAVTAGQKVVVNIITSASSTSPGEVYYAAYKTTP